jgi:PfaB family protein
MAGLAILFGEATGSRGLGSAKALLGHTMAASGIAAVLHAALALHERYIPPVPRWSGPKGSELDDAGFFVTPLPLPWLASRSEPRAALVTGLGLDGCSAALALIEEADDRSAAVASLPTTACPLRVIAALGSDPADLVASIEMLKQRLATCTDLSALASELGCAAGRDLRPLACALVGSTVEELGREATALLAALPRAFETGKPWQSPYGSCFAPRPLGRSGRIVFVYSGMSGLTVGMGRDLFRLLPSAHHLMASCSDPREALNASLLFPHGLRPAALLAEEESHERLQNSPLDLLKLGIILPTLSTALIREALGLEPDITMGYSLGELSMMYAAGGWTLGDEQIDRLRDSSALSRLMGAKEAVLDHYGLPKGVVPQWASHVLLAPRDRVLEAVECVDRVFLTQVNTPSEVVIAGEPAQCRAVIDIVKCDAVQIPAPLVIHCPPAEAEFNGIVRLLRAPLGNKPKAIPYFAADDSISGLDRLSVVERIARGFCERLDFPRLVRRAYQDQARIFVDVGPGAACTRWISETLGDSDHLAVAISQRGVPEAVSLARLEAALISHRVPMRKPGLVRAEVRSKRKTRIELGGLPRTAGLRDPALRERFRARQSIAAVAAVSCKKGPASDNPPASAPIAPKFDALRAIVENSRSQAAAHESLIRLSQRSVAQTGNGVARHRPMQAPRRIVLDEAAVMEFAEGRLSNVFGPNWAPIDDYPRRLRLPSPPFLALSRVTAMEGQPGTLGPAYIRTEFDVPNPAWYGVEGQAPYLALDAQGILVLVSWLGIDRINQGRRHYRWLDATFTFLGDMPKEGETIGYDISLRRFSEAGDALLFYTDFDCTVGGRPMMRIRDCCAGFFTAEDLKQGDGITAAHRTVDRKPYPCAKPRAEPPRSLGNEALMALSRGNVAAAFGRNGRPYDHRPGLKLPPPAMLMIDRVPVINATGGTRGAGEIIAEKQLDPADWFIRTHFKDDPVFAGPCMLEGSRQALQVFMLACGMDPQGEMPARFQPVLDSPTRIRFRGQVPGERSVFTYHLDIVGLGYVPDPWVIADVDFLHGGRVIGRIEGLGMRIALERSPVSVKRP